MMNWRLYSRTILSIAALIAILATGSGELRLSNACDGPAMAAAMEGCPHHPADSAAASDCTIFICATTQPALPPLGIFHHAAILTLLWQAAPQNDLQRRDLRGPPDLRPPRA